MKLHTLFLVSICATTSGCNGNSEEALLVDEKVISNFIGTWKACQVDGTAGDARLSFVFDGDNAAFVSETIGFNECRTDFLTEELAIGTSPYVRTGKLIFENPIIDSALGFSSYPVIFINSNENKPDITELIYTDGNVLYFGVNGSRPIEDEAPTALDTLVTYEYTGPPDTDFLSAH